MNNHSTKTIPSNHTLVTDDGLDSKKVLTPEKVLAPEKARAPEKALAPEKIESLLFEINTRLKSPWMLVDNQLHKTFILADFTEAFAFMTHCALHAERLNHHPDWHNVYNQVTINLMTHDFGGISLKDFTLIKAIEQLSF